MVCHGNACSLLAATSGQEFILQAVNIGGSAQCDLQGPSPYHHKPHQFPLVLTLFMSLGNVKRRQSLLDEGWGKTRGNDKTCHIRMVTKLQGFREP